MDLKDDDCSFQVKEKMAEFLVGSDIHPGIGCDACGVYPIRGIRYNCTVCIPSYDLCQDCNSLSIHSEHKMTSIKRSSAFNVNKHLLPFGKSCIGFPSFDWLVFIRHIICVFVYENVNKLHI